MFWQKSYRLEWYLIIWHYLNLYAYSISFIARHFLLWKLTGAKFNFETMFQQERNLWPGIRFWVCVHGDLGLECMTLGKGHDTLLGPGQQLCKILSRSNMAVRSCGTDTDFGVYALWPWEFDLGSRSWHTLVSWRIIVQNIIQIQHGRKELWPEHRSWVCVHCVLDLWDMALSQGKRSWHTLGSWTAIVWNIVQIQHASEGLWPGHGFLDMCSLWPWSWRYDLV